MDEGNQKESKVSPAQEPVLSPAQQAKLDEQLDQWMPHPSILGTGKHYESSLDVEQQSQRGPEAFLQYYPATVDVTSSKRKWKLWQKVTAAILGMMLLVALFGTVIETYLLFGSA